MGNATRAVSLLTEHDKEYIATCQLGVVTDTQDMSGNILKESPVSVTSKELSRTLSRFTGDYEQLPPMYSAIKVGGKRLYELARQGIEVERKPRMIHIERITLLDDSELEAGGRFTMEVRCSKGTYIRTLCNDIGEALGCGAAMAQLTRTAVGAFRLEESRTLSQLEEFRDRGELESLIVPTAEIFRDMDTITVKPEVERLVMNGNPFRPDDIMDCSPASIDGLSDEEPMEAAEGQRFRVMDTDGRFYGIYVYSARTGQYRVERFFYSA